MNGKLIFALLLLVSCAAAQEGTTSTVLTLDCSRDSKNTKLLEALKTRVLSSAELKEVAKRGWWITVVPCVAFEPEEKKQEFYAALMEQVDLQSKYRTTFPSEAKTTMILATKAEVDELRERIARLESKINELEHKVAEGSIVFGDGLYREVKK